MSFTLDIRNINKRVKANADQVVRGTLAGISNRIIKRTPVGNPSIWKDKPPKGYIGGSLRGSWQATINQAEAPIKIPTIDADGASTVIKASGIANNYKVGQTFYLINPLPYAYRVEFGWSQQAPAGMVRTSIAETQQIIDAL